jgi:deoxyadenosine/deoxycytidine kinase
MAFSHYIKSHGSPKECYSDVDIFFWEKLGSSVYSNLTATQRAVITSYINPQYLKNGRDPRLPQLSTEPSFRYREKQVEMRIVASFGVTGPVGAGKSTIVSRVMNHFIARIKDRNEQDSSGPCKIFNAKSFYVIFIEDFSYYLDRFCRDIHDMIHIEANVHYRNIFHSLIFLLDKYWDLPVVLVWDRSPMENCIFGKDLDYEMVPSLFSNWYPNEAHLKLLKMMMPQQMFYIDCSESERARRVLNRDSNDFEICCAKEGTSVVTWPNTLAMYSALSIPIMKLDNELPDSTKINAAFIYDAILTNYQVAHCNSDDPPKDRFFFNES